MAEFSVPDMHCNHCRAKIEDALLDADDGAFLEFDMEARKVSVDSMLDTEQVKAALAKAGYPAAE